MKKGFKLFGMRFKFNIKKFIIGCAVGIVLLTAITGGAIADRLFGFKPLDKFFKSRSATSFNIGQRVVDEESVVIDVVEKVSPSVVTVSIKTPQRKILQFSPFGGFREGIQGGEDQDIGSGFIVSKDGLVVTNKHVVSNTEASYKVITKEGKEYGVKEISRDPSNDIAILKIDAHDLKSIELGDSSELKVGQVAIAIGTALGEFRHTVTKGVISGLGRGITAGSVYEGYVERLDDVIQTDAAINPGNSGGPLLNSAGQVIGINVAVAQGAQNIGFAIPINIVKDGLKQFESTGKFVSKPYLGVRYQMIPKRTAIMNNVPEGAYIVEVVSGSPAEKGGVKVDDIIVKIDGKNLNDKNSLSDMVASKKPGDRIVLEIWRDSKTLKISVNLSEFNQ